ncbi:hypothetical protein [Candidatus Enterococcus courvalinii]|uniref:Uncharacterized protein n=1 Tax=Candidatus Enterococcus courvalinii TaxID=2815329 RepID=A0ABS3HYG1_9ENTE|nr:hypothetical protein [Enterococcus sp. MSG2901]MBO0481503.1 hypothetical protein [Enterococcus sp. MSG2901]
MDENTVQEAKTKRPRKKKVDPFIEMTDKIIEKQGLKPKDFDQKAIREARQKLYDEFVKENIGLLLD